MPDDAKTYLNLYQTMVTIRQFETMAGELFAKGTIPGFIHLSIGQEGSSVGVCSVLRSDDYLTTTHRGHGHMIAKGADLNKMVAELFGKKTGYCKGKGGSMHIADFSIGFLGANGVVAGGLPIITGAGLSIKMRKTDQVAVCFFGDGASNRGPVHEAMNMASIWKLPVIFCVENNQFASTTRTSYACSVEDISTRAGGYNMPGVSVDANDILALVSPLMPTTYWPCARQRPKQLPGPGKGKDRHFSKTRPTGSRATSREILRNIGMKTKLRPGKINWTRSTVSKKH